MNFIAPRTCRVVSASQSAAPSEDKSVPLAGFAQSNAYVLIGEPGSGKSTALRTESEARDGVYLQVSDFLTLDRPAWRGTTLFLDGLDEVRAGEVNGRLPLERVLAKLDLLGCPRFRLSCRWADWLGAYDREPPWPSFGTAIWPCCSSIRSPKMDIKRILAENHEIADPAGIHRRRPASAGSPACSPIRRTSTWSPRRCPGGKWPVSRRETFEDACRMLVIGTKLRALRRKPHGRKDGIALWTKLADFARCRFSQVSRALHTARLL